MKDIDLHLINAEQSFKKAINHAYDLGWDANQERIIKLLEERKCGCYCEVHMVLDPAIAAIKGEK